MSWSKDLFGSRPAIQAAMWFSRRLSTRGAERIVRLIASLICLGRGNMYWAVRRNQAQVRGLPAHDERLNEAVYEVILHAGRTYYDLFRFAARGETLPIRAAAGSQEHLQAALGTGRPVVVAGAHLSNFDFTIQYVVSQHIPAQLLSLAEPTPGFQLLNQLRANPLCEVTPVSESALRSAIRRLRGGGVVGTGVDRPVKGQQEPIEFFGRPAKLPIGHIRMAMKTNATLLVLWCEWSPNSGYSMRIAPPLEIDHMDDPTRTIYRTARKVLAIIEAAIARHPEQWMMFVPVWPAPGDYDKYPPPAHSLRGHAVKKR